MRAPLFPLLILLAVNLAVDAYIYIQAKKRCHNRIWSRLQLWTSAVLTLVMVAAIILPARTGSENELLGKMWLLFGYISVYFSKILAIIVDLLARLPGLFRHRRLKWLTAAGTALAVITFAAFWWGALINRYRIDVREVTVEIPSLPEAFDGKTIAQFSDLHTGTFHSDTTFVSKLVDRINSLNPDITVFTGDIVNRQSSELLPFISPLSRLHAPMGVYAILGNHDYGDYRNWASAADKQTNMNMLYDAYRKTGIDLLRNRTQWLHAAGDSIALIGVENIGDPPFKTYGSLSASYPTLNDDVTKILLSHNPQHWVDSISGHNDMNIALTLAGHTHAMQMEIGHLSPAALRYKTWGGLYADKDSLRNLYVNIGSGTVGLPARIGATPEITLITLRRK